MEENKLGLSIDDVLAYLKKHFKYATHAHRIELAEILKVPFRLDKPAASGQPGEFRIDNSFDILEEVKEQMGLVRILRAQILKAGVQASPKDLQSLVSTTTSLFAMLTKYSSEIHNQDRIKSIETAVTELISEMVPELQTRYFNRLEELLSE